tara:strand:- start:5988 stop:6287 length:300 start_codon:yes stop_codon:yes gene_type:complete
LLEQKSTPTNGWRIFQAKVPQLLPAGKLARQPRSSFLQYNRFVVQQSWCESAEMMEKQGKEPEFYTGEPVEPCDLWFRDEFIDLVWETLRRRHVLIASP